MALASSASIVEQTLDLDVDYVSYYNLLTTISRNRKLSKLFKNGYKIKSVKFLYGLGIDKNGGELRIGQAYALITLSKESCELLAVFIDIVKRKVAKVFHVKRA